LTFLTKIKGSPEQLLTPTSSSQ